MYLQEIVVSWKLKLEMNKIQWLQRKFGRVIYDEDIWIVFFFSKLIIKRMNNVELNNNVK